jgi:hypothetical protein
MAQQLPISPLYIKQTLPRNDNGPSQLPGAIDLFGALSVTSQFKVSLHLADGPNDLLKWLTDSGVIDNKDKRKNIFYDFFCAEAALPGVVFDTAEEFGSRQGVLEKFPTKKVYTDFTITLYVDNEYQNIRLFEEWMNYINPIYTSASNEPLPASAIGQGRANLTTDFFRVRYPDEYRKTISISKFERDFYTGGGSGSKRAQPTTLTYRMIDAYPTNITAIPVTYEGSQITKTTISFTYSRYIIEKYQAKQD